MYMFLKSTLIIFSLFLLCYGVVKIDAAPPSGTCYKRTSGIYEGPSCSVNAECTSFTGVWDLCCFTSPPGTNSDCVFGSTTRNLVTVTHPTGNCGVLCWDYEGEYGTYCTGGNPSPPIGGTDTGTDDSLSTPCT